MKCKNCKYWQYEYNDAISSKPMGKCVRYPPQIISSASVDGWPRVNGDQWCGEHQKIEENNE